LLFYKNIKTLLHYEFDILDLFVANAHQLQLSIKYRRL